MFTFNVVVAGVVYLFMIHKLQYDSIVYSE